MTTQSCPNCQRTHDVGVYVTGQRILCSCGIKFEVRRTDVSGIGRPINARAAGAGSAGSVVETVAARPKAAVAAPEPMIAGDVEVTYRPPSRVPTQEISVNVLAGEPANGLGVAAPLADASGDAFTSDAVSSTRMVQPAIEIPGFELQQLLGRGGMGEVWRAHQKSLGRMVAVKLLPEELARDPEFVQRFEKESAALAALSHPHIIQIIDRGSSGAHYYFVMEFVDGRSLREVMTQKRPTPQETLRIVLQILRAIEAAHEKGIIHRDLKPENILVDARGHVKVADFGLAGMRGGEERLQLTATAVAMGTINYMAPEQRRDARNVDQRADLYSVGVILYELLTGDLPVGRFRMPSEQDPQIDPRFDEVVGKLLDTDPMRRYVTATEVIAALEPLQTISGVTVAAAVAVAGAPLARAQASSGVRTAVVPRPGTIVEKGFRSMRVGLMVIGALALIAIGTRLLFGRGATRVLRHADGADHSVGPAQAHAAEDPPKLRYTQNSQSEVYSAVVGEAKGKNDRLTLGLSFDPGQEEINVHSGEWKLADGALKAVQVGSETDGTKLVPRAYLAKRYFSSDDFDVEVEVSYKDVRDRYVVPDDVQRFAEVAFRIKDLQVSAFAIPGTGMRLGWRYFTQDGKEVTGNSSLDLALMVEDEMPAPHDGAPFRLRLSLRKVKDAVQVIAYLNGHPFARKVLPGLQGQTGKVALGCRNYECEFRQLTVSGKVMPKPERRPVASQ